MSLLVIKYGGAQQGTINNNVPKYELRTQVLNSNINQIKPKTLSAYFNTDRLIDSGL